MRSDCDEDILEFPHRSSIGRQRLEGTLRNKTASEAFMALQRHSCRGSESFDQSMNRVATELD